MTYFNYHAKVKKLIYDGELKSFYFDENYKKIGRALILDFGFKTYPIREKWFDFYIDLIKELYTVEQIGDKYFNVY